MKKNTLSPEAFHFEGKMSLKQALPLGMSAGSLLSYAGSQLLDLPARHMLAVASAVAGGICFLFVKPVATVEKQQGNG